MLSVKRKNFRIKKKTFYNPLIVHIKSVADLNQIATEIPAKAMLLADAFLARSTDISIKKTKHNPRFSYCRKNTVRVPNHPVTLSTFRTINFPLAPSANPFGSINQHNM
jgi:L-threonylcarbamoyladenylate synthase